MPIRQTPPAVTQTWVFIAYANQIKTGKIESVHYMERDLVLWKSATGVISLQDAYCPHMGAHLGFGKICGEAIQCVFHKRAFNTDGHCSGKGKNNKNYQISVINNLVFAWFGETPPTWEMPDLLSGFTDDVDSKWKILRSKKLNYNFHPKDLLDNTVDAKHFKTFHNQCVSYDLPQIMEASPSHFISKVVFTGSPQLKLNKEMQLELVSESYGPCTLIVNSTVNIFKQKYFFKFIFLCTPTTQGHTDFTLAVATRVQPKNKLSLVRSIIENLYNHYAFHMQIKEFKKESEEIWKHKTHLAQPDIGSQEEAMHAYNEWYGRFYVTAL